LLPLPVLGRVAAGLPISAEGVARLGPVGEGGEALWLDRRLFSPRPDYLLRVQGDSMIEDGILDGDLVGVHRTPEARDGQTVVARVEGELTIKRLQRGADRIRLLPRNPAHAPIEVHPGQDFAIDSRLAARTLWHAGRSARLPADGEPSGHAALDARLPQGGWPRRALTELLLPANGVGELALLLPTIARMTAAGGTVVLVA